MIFPRMLLLLLSVQIGGTLGKPAWWSLVKDAFDNPEFPLKRCDNKDNVAPKDERCGKKKKTCFFGDQTCAGGTAYPNESCICDGSPTKFGMWACFDVPCPEEVGKEDGDRSATIAPDAPTPIVTKAPVSEDPTTEAPATKAPISSEAAPSTAAPITEVPTIAEDSITELPIAELPNTTAPATVAPAASSITSTPITAAPASRDPTTTQLDIPAASNSTEAPITEVPVTVPPNTEAPITAAPTSRGPTTPSPTTSPPTTEAPITAAPTSRGPTTPSPTTSPPTTAQPTTEAPITAAPTSRAPTTPSPTTSPPTIPTNPPTVDPLCEDATKRNEVPWTDRFGDGCRVYEIYGFCIPYGNEDANGGLTGNQACCTCGGGKVDPVTNTCTDLPNLVGNDIIPWRDSARDGCSWYAQDPQTRCIAFANENDAAFGMTVGEACCACKGVVKPALEDATCKDLAGWTTAENQDCSQVTKVDCIFRTENFGVAVGDACCKCGSRENSSNAPTKFDPPTSPQTAGSCVTDNTKFDMCIKMSTNIATVDIARFTAAADKWGQVIVEDSPDFVYSDNTIVNEGFNYFGRPTSRAALNTLYRNMCGYDPNFPAGATDDVNVCVTQRILNVGVLADAVTVYGDKFTRFGRIRMNADSVGPSRARGRQLYDTIFHELGHILGIGSLWTDSTPGQVNVDRNCNYIGRNANRAYQQLSGCNNARLPIQEPFGGGRCGGHLLEQCFRNEVMSSNANLDDEKMSTVTIALLEDLGYKVDYAQADPTFTKASLAPFCRCNGGRMLEEEEEAPPTSHQRALSERGRTIVDDYAARELRKLRQLIKSSSAELSTGDDDDDMSFGIPVMTVVYVENEVVHTLFYTGDGED